MTTGASTNSLTNILFDLLNSDLSNNNYYAAIGRNPTWAAAPPDVTNSIRNSHLVRQQMHSYKKISLASFVVPRVNWVTSTVYTEYDDNFSSLSNFYVLNSLDEVFVCVSAPIDGSVSTDEPNTTKQKAVHTYNPARSFKTNDGYVWRYLYTLSNLAKDKFLSTTYMPVKTISGSPTIVEEIEQKALQDSSIDGEIINFKILGGGSSNNNGVGNPTTILGGGSGAQFFGIGNASGVLTDIEIDSDGFGIISHGSGYLKASISPDTPGAAFTARSVLGPRGGLNKNPVQTLNAKTIMIATEIQDDEGTANLTTGNRFHQVSLVKDPKNPAGVLVSDDALNAMRRLTVSSISGITTNATITGATTNAQALVVDKVSGPPNYIYYVQRDSDGFAPFQIGESLGSQTISFDSDAPVDTFSGELLFSDNFATVQRQSSQTEDLRIVINLSNCE